MTSGILNFFTPSVFLASLAGVVIGLIFGLMPGIGVAAAMAIILPLTFGMDANVALSLLLAVHAVGVTGGSVTAILLGIPGTPLNAATVLDGFPMTKKGQGGRAVGAALCSSGLGGLFGAVILIALIPVAYQTVLAFGSGETLMVSLMGLTFIAVLSRGSTLKGLASGLVGIALGFVGSQAISGVPRFTFGSLYLLEGFTLIPFILGMFALPEVIDLALKGRGTIAEVDKQTVTQTQWSQVWQGAKDVFRHWWLFLRCSAIGTGIGIIPGVGGEVALFVSYGHAKQTSRHPEMYGQGIIEGVIAPESANNSKEGGSMLPTLAFGIPGSVVMAILLGAMVIQGITPGPAMLREHLDLSWTLITCLVVSNILGVALLLPIIGKFANLAFVRGSILVPLILVACSFGAYASHTEFLDIAMTFIWGLLGYAMIKLGYNRVALLLGFILADAVERYAYLAYRAYGFEFLLQPITLILLIITLFMLFSPQLRRFFNIVRGKKT
ncbi:tripartite tricarboxylate transporter permease [Chloroflexota bacterium]